MAKEKAETKQRYVVAPGVSFVGNKRAYVAGDEIDESAFNKPENFKRMLSGKNPKIIPAPPKDTAEKETAPKTGGENTGGGLDRAALEAAAVNSGLYKKDELAAMSDDELKKDLEEAGLLK